MRCSQQAPASRSLLPAPLRPTLAPPQAFIAEHCIECHNSTDQSAAALFAGLFFDKVDVLARRRGSRDLGKGRPQARRRHDAARFAKPRPDPAAQAQFLTYLERELDAHARADPNPGRPSLHRVNRAEYANAIRDLLALEVDATALLPADDSSHGFDNIAGSLGVSPVLLERYVAAAGKISRLAIGDTTMPDGQEKYLVPGDLTQNQHLPGMPFGTRGGATFTHHFPVDAEYVFAPTSSSAAAACSARTWVRPSSSRSRWMGSASCSRTSRSTQVETGAAIRMPVKAGPHTLGAAFIKKNHAPVEDVIQPFEFSLFEPAVDGDPNWTFVPHLASMAVTGPLRHRRRRHPDAAAIFVCRPASERDEAQCARQIVETLATRAFRHPVDREQLSTLMDFYAAGREQGGFEAGIEMALRRILASTRVRVPLRARGRRRRARRDLPHQRSRARIAAVVLPLEQHPRRRAARARRSTTSSTSPHAAQAGAAHARRSRARMH